MTPERYSRNGQYGKFKGPATKNKEMGITQKN